MDVHVHAEGEDKIIWSLESKGTFSVKSRYKRMLGSNDPYFPAKAIWKSKAPMKGCFLTWVASKAKVPTENMHKRRNFNLTSRCAMCLEEEELAIHLIVHCHWVSSL